MFAYHRRLCRNMGAHSERAGLAYVMGVSGRSPQRGPEAEPLVSGSHFISFQNYTHMTATHSFIFVY